MRPLPRLLLTAVLGCACLATQAGCPGLFQPQVPVNPDGTPLTPLQQQRRALDTVREQYGLALDVIEPLISTNVITDPQTLAAIRAINKQMRGDPAKATKGDIADAQSSLEAGQTVTASFFIDRAAGAAATMLRVRDTYKGRP